MFDSFIIDSVTLNDFLLGFFIALALRRGRLDKLLDQYFPVDTGQD